jgi:oligoendopeptidase F
MSKELPKRSEVPPEYTWDLTPIYADDAAWESAMQALAARLPEIAHFQGRLGEGPAVLAEWLVLQAEIERELGRIVVYAHCQHSVDTRDQAATARYHRAGGLYARVAAALSFVEPELLALGVDTLKTWVEQEPALALYAHYVDTLAQKAPHVRSSEVEELLGLLSDPFRSATSIHKVLAEADLEFRPAQASDSEEPIPVAQGTIYALMSHDDRTVRRTAWESYADAHLAHRHAMANCMATGVKQSVLISRARRYDSSLAWALGENHIPTAVYHQVIDTYRANLPIWHRYWRVRRKALGHPLAAYDDKAPLSHEPPEIPFAQAAEWICEGMTPLWQEYVDIMRHGLLQERWVDVLPNRNKAAGAFSTGSPGTPPLVLMSYSDDIGSLSTLAHELGHSMHSYYAWRTQPQIYADYGIFMAEVASNLNQALVREYLLRTQPDPAFQLALLDEAMANFYRYFFLMPTLARFELAIHQQVEGDDALTANGMMALMLDLFHEAYGGEVELDEERVGITWAEFHTHLYARYYVYQYTTGIAAAQALAGRLLDREPGAVEAYVRFLKTGSSTYPLDTLRAAGVDMTTAEPIQQAFDYMAGLVDRLESLV